MIPFLDISVEALTILLGFASSLIRYLMQGRDIQTGEAISAFLNGSSSVPFGVLAFAPFSPPWYEIALSSKGSLALAGGVGLFFIIGEICSPTGLRRGSKSADSA